MLNDAYAFEKAKIALLANKKLSAKDKQQKVSKLQDKYSQYVNKEADKLKTCRIHETLMPVSFAHWFPPCLLRFG